MKLTILDELKPFTKQIKENLDNTSHNIKQGKNIRSYLGFLILKSLGIKIEKKHIQFLTAIELIQTASLFHDDIIDNEIIRRNKEEHENNKINIIKGDIILTEAFKQLIQLNNVEIIEEINNTITKMCKGELLEQNNIFKIPLLKNYLYKTELKTVSLFQAIFNGLNILSGLNNNISEYLYNFGMTYQIKNDLDNIKESQSDIKNGIYTAPVIFSNGLEISKTGIEKTTSLIDNYQEGAIESLKELDDTSYKLELKGIVKCLTK